MTSVLSGTWGMFIFLGGGRLLWTPTLRRLHKASLGQSSICAIHVTLGCMVQGASPVFSWALGRIYKQSRAPSNWPQMGLGTSGGSTQAGGLMTSLISKFSNFCEVFFLVLNQAQQRHGAGFSLPLSLLTFLFFFGNQKLLCNFPIYWICPGGLRLWPFALCFALWSFPEAMNVEYPIAQNRGHKEIGKMAGGTLVSASQIIDLW